MSIDESVDAFSEQVNSTEASDPKVTSRGQFYWSELIKDKMKEVIRNNTTSLLDPLRDKFDNLFDAADSNDIVKMAKIIAEINEELNTRSGPSSERLRKLLVPSGKFNTALSLWIKFNKINKVPKDVDNLINIHDYARINKEEETACWNVADLIIKRFVKRGGYSGEDPDKKRSPANKFQAGLSSSGTRHLEWSNNLTKGDVVKYPSSLGKTIKRMKKALDDGFLIHARVVSGTNFGFGLHKELEASKNETPDPKEKPISGIAEHSLVIIGFDNDTFVFWDPDSNASDSKGDGQDHRRNK